MVDIFTEDKGDQKNSLCSFPYTTFSLSSEILNWVTFFANISWCISCDLIWFALATDAIKKLHCPNSLSCKMTVSTLLFYHGFDVRYTVMVALYFNFKIVNMIIDNSSMEFNNIRNMASVFCWAVSCFPFVKRRRLPVIENWLMLLSQLYCPKVSEQLFEWLSNSYINNAIAIMLPESWPMPLKLRFCGWSSHSAETFGILRQKFVGKT